MSPHPWFLKDFFAFVSYCQNHVFHNTGVLYCFMPGMLTETRLCFKICFTFLPISADNLTRWRLFQDGGEEGHAPSNSPLGEALNEVPSISVLDTHPAPAALSSAPLKTSFECASRGWGQLFHICDESGKLGSFNHCSLLAPSLDTDAISRGIPSPGPLVQAGKTDWDERLLSSWVDPWMSRNASMLTIWTTIYMSLERRFAAMNDDPNQSSK